MDPGPPRGLSSPGGPVDDLRVSPRSTTPARLRPPHRFAIAVAVITGVTGGSAVAQSAGTTPDRPDAPAEVQPIRIDDLPIRKVGGATQASSAEQDVSVDLRAIEPSISDRGPLDASLRWIPAGLRLPTGYDQVYRLDNGGLMRADGGLVATFEQSIYQSTRSGIAPTIPASTLFVIGGVPLGTEPGHGRLLAVDPLDPGAIPTVTPPASTPDAAYRSSATPGDRLRRFGYGAGHRISDRASGDVESTSIAPGSRFTTDAGYRARRLAARLVSWRNARVEIDPRAEVEESPTAGRPDSAP